MNKPMVGEIKWHGQVVVENFDYSAKELEKSRKSEEWLTS